MKRLVVGWLVAWCCLFLLVFGSPELAALCIGMAIFAWVTW